MGTGLRVPVPLGGQDVAVTGVVTGAGGAWLVARDIVTWSAVALTVYSGLAYVVLALPRLRQADPSTTLP